jgi:hypothetical protein
VKQNGSDGNVGVKTVRNKAKGVAKGRDNSEELVVGL